ncbi:hypothetical protein MHUMG1_04041 [Metarhizium humberi]|uniref:Uncharacterized protein n=1 Tax=Metarhizium humberi TaxID=2596975 RepID=A0A9P8MF13_9HYPO|nr:hypothetical protein MHUMG1_04041 [Metarhizium humberi]
MAGVPNLGSGRILISHDIGSSECDLLLRGRAEQEDKAGSASPVTADLILPRFLAIGCVCIIQIVFTAPDPEEAGPTTSDADEENCSSQVLGRVQDKVPRQILSAGTDETAVQPILSSSMGEYDSSRTSYLDTAFSSWGTSTLTGPVEQVAWTDDVQPAEQQDDQFSMLIPHDDGNPGLGCHDEPRRLTSNPAGMDMVERVACILRYLGTMGFDNFDELVCTYYTQNFHESSLLCNEQRLSRHKRLPGVFSSVFCASGNWSI